MIKKILTIFGYLFLAVMIAGVILYNSKDILTIFRQVKWWLVATHVLLHIPIIALGGWAFQILCEPFNIKVRWRDWLGLSFIANLVNQILPYRPGMGVRYWYLHKYYQMTISSFMYVMLMFFLLMLFTSAAWALLGWSIGKLPHHFDFLILLAGSIIVIITLLLIWLKMRGAEMMILRHSKQFSLPAIFHNLLHSLRIMINQPKTLGLTLLVFLSSNLLTTLIFHLIFSTLGVPLPWSDCLFLVGIMSIAMIFPVTPGNIGVLETLVGTFTQLLYQNFGLGFSVVALFRMTQWIPAIIFGSYFSFTLIGSIIPSFIRFNLGANKRVD